jgi:hypothetical protein
MNSKQVLNEMLNPMKSTNADDPVLVQEWDAEAFHQRVLELEEGGYVARPESYSITPEVHPETGIIIHLYIIEMFRPDRRT